MSLLDLALTIPGMMVCFCLFLFFGAALEQIIKSVLEKRADAAYWNYLAEVEKSKREAYSARTRKGWVTRRKNEASATVTGKQKAA